MKTGRICDLSFGKYLLNEYGARSVFTLLMLSNNVCYFHCHYQKSRRNPIFRPILTVFRHADAFAHLKHPIFWDQKIELVEFYRLVYYSYKIVHENCTVICRYHAWHMTDPMLLGWYKYELWKYMRERRKWHFSVRFSFSFCECEKIY